MANIDGIISTEWTSTHAFTHRLAKCDQSRRGQVGEVGRGLTSHRRVAGESARHRTKFVIDQDIGARYFVIATISDSPAAKYGNALARRKRCTCAHHRVRR